MRTGLLNWVIIIGLFGLPHAAFSAMPINNWQNISDILEASQSQEQSDEQEVELDEEGKKSLAEMSTKAEADPDFWSQIYGQAEEDEDGLGFEDTEGFSTCQYQSPAKIWQAKNNRKKKSGNSCRQGVNVMTAKCCLVAVRNYLGIRNSLGVVCARDSGAALKAHGLSRCSGVSPRTAKDRTVFVYSGGSCGHIEMKKGKSFCFGPCNGFPATEWRTTKRRLIGVYRKGGC